jgi:hypothetical protein
MSQVKDELLNRFQDFTDFEFIEVKSVSDIRKTKPHSVFFCSSQLLIASQKRDAKKREFLQSLLSGRDRLGLVFFDEAHKTGTGDQTKLEIQSIIQTYNHIKLPFIFLTATYYNILFDYQIQKANTFIWDYTDVLATRSLATETEQEDAVSNLQNRFGKELVNSVIERRIGNNETLETMAKAYIGFPDLFFISADFQEEALGRFTEQGKYRPDSGFSLSSIFALRQGISIVDIKTEENKVRRDAYRIFDNLTNPKNIISLITPKETFDNPDILGTQGGEPFVKEEGSIIEPSLLERSKIKINRPVAENILHTASINTMDTILIEMSVPTYTGSLNMNDGITFEATLPYYSGSYDIIENLNITTEYPTYGGNYSVIGNITSSASILSNLPNAGGIVIEIDCGLKNPTVLGEVDLEDSYQQVGNDADSPFNKGFGIVGFNGAVDRTYYKESGNLVLTERYNSYIITVKYTRSVPRRVPANGLSGSLFNTSKLAPTDKVVLEKIARYEKKLILIDPIDYSLGVPAFRAPLQHSFYIDILAGLGTYPYKNGIITAIEPFVGLTSGHYSNTKDTTRGLENSFYMGSKQTSLTTLDGTPAVETFSTNPNRLRVGPTGRGSGEPILEVD